MKYFYFLTCVFFLAIFSGCRPAAAPVSVSNKPISINDVPQTNLPLPPKTNVGNLGWTLFDGKTEKLNDYKGKVVILDFWATYCPPCLEEIPHLVKLQNQYADLKIVGLHVGGDDDRPKVPAFVEKLKITYALGQPEDDLTAFLLGGSDVIPQTVIFDRAGNPIKRYVGFDEIIKMQIDKAVEEAVKQ